MSTKALDYVCEMFEWISETPGRNAKIEGLELMKSTGGEVEVFAASLLSISLDWFRHFGIGTLPEVESTAPDSLNTPAVFFQTIAQLENKSEPSDRELVLRTLQGYSPRTSKWLRRCILKDLRMGVSHTTANKVWPGLVRTFACSLADEVTDISEIRFPVLVEPKIDGVRAVAIIKDGEVDFLSRGGKPLFNLKAIEDILLTRYGAASEDIVVDGELYVESLHKTLGVVKSSVSDPDPDLLNDLVYYAFDNMVLDEWVEQKSSYSQLARSTLCAETNAAGGKVQVPLLKDIEWPCIANSESDLERFYEKALEERYEGIMIKDIDAVYKFKRSLAWRKYKPFDVDEFEITGVYEGEGRHAGRLGGFILDIKGVPCNCGGGLSDTQRDSYWRERNSTIIGCWIRVKYKEITPDGKLREPVFQSFVSKHGSATV